MDAAGAAPAGSSAANRRPVKKTGKKAKKKALAEGKERHNRKAFIFSGGTKSVQRKVQQAADKTTKKQHAPILDKNPDIPPPFIVVVHGPPGCGKTTLVRSLVKNYSKQNIAAATGPITLVTSKHRRVTIFEAPANDIAAQMDLAKVADLCLIMINALVGFEMETFEFINVLQNHGFPKILGVLTHLDGFAETKAIRKKKKEFKQRFWAEIYDGAKLFFFSGLQYGRYPKTEVSNLARFIAVQKTPIVAWRAAHPYLLAHRVEDQTDPNDPNAESRRKLHIYGYTYGARLREGQFVHLAGVGDFPIAGLEAYTDPCPSPLVQERERAEAAGRLDDRGKKKINNLRTLQEKHKAIYAPGCDIGNVLMDKDAVYIKLPSHRVGFTKTEDEQSEDENPNLPEAVRMVRALQNKVGALDSQLEGAEVFLTKKSKTPLAGNDGSGESGERGAGRRVAPAFVEGAINKEEEDGDFAFPDVDDDDGSCDEEEEGLLSENEDLLQEGGSSSSSSTRRSCEELENRRFKKQTLQAARERFEKDVSLEDLIYGAEYRKTSGRIPKGAAGAALTPQAKNALFQDTTVRSFEAQGEVQKIPLFDDESDEENFSKTEKVDNGLEVWRLLSLADEAVWLWDAERCARLKDKHFVTGTWDNSEEADELRALTREAGEDDSENDSGAESDESVDLSSLSPEELRARKERKMRTKMEKEDKKKEKEANADDGQYGNSTEARRNIVKRVNADDMLEHQDALPIGSYVRIILEDVPRLSAESLTISKPLIVGGLLPGELKMGLLQLRVKRHRWVNGVLKTNDPILCSMGWRRYQTMPIYSLEDRGQKRNRFLKYSPEHMHCLMTFWGPLVPPKSGAVFLKNWQHIAGYRISATGLVLETGTEFSIVKKLKLTGEPYKIFKNTAFIKNMFTSDLEVNKALHSKLQTVSGIRGEIKKAEGTEGHFRATFEDRLLMSDLALLKAWVDVPITKFYNPMLDVPEWRKMKTMGQLKYELGLKAGNDKKDSEYGVQNVRTRRKFSKLTLPARIEQNLPFKTLPKQDGISGVRKTKTINNLMTKKIAKAATAVIRSDREREEVSLLNRLHTVKRERQRVVGENKVRKKMEKAKKDKHIQERRDAHTKENLKKGYREMGKEEMKKRKRLRLGEDD